MWNILSEITFSSPQIRFMINLEYSSLLNLSVRWECNILHVNGRLSSEDNRLSAASLQVQSLHQRLIIPSLRQLELHVPGQSIVQGDLTNAQPVSEETPFTTTKPSTQLDLRLSESVTTKHVKRTLPTWSDEWKALRQEVLLRDNRTCSTCGYLSPRKMETDQTTIFLTWGYTARPVTRYYTTGSPLASQLWSKLK